MLRPTVLVIAGFDPSGGAGIVADAKTLETIGVHAIFVQTCNTIQNDIEFKQCHWTADSIIWEQLEILLARHTPNVIKIGVVRSSDFLIALLRFLNYKIPQAKIIWDPIIQSSSGFNFHGANHFANMEKTILQQLDLITPNFQELLQLTSRRDFNSSIKRLSKHTRVYLKGGHRKALGVDELYQPMMPKKVYPPTLDCCSEKHGSGCVLSSAIAAYYALSNNWEESCQSAKIYVEHFLASTIGLIGTHSILKS